MAKHQQQVLKSSVPSPVKSVECLGAAFGSEAARRSHFIPILRSKLQQDAFLKLDGFPIATTDGILQLSDPPHYTACPNPFIAEFVKTYGKPYRPDHDKYEREPFAAD